MVYTSDKLPINDDTITATEKTTEKITEKTTEKIFSIIYSNLLFWYTCSSSRYSSFCYFRHKM